MTRMVTARRLGGHAPVMALRKAGLTRLSRAHAWTLSSSAASARRAMIAQSSGDRGSEDAPSRGGGGEASVMIVSSTGCWCESLEVPHRLLPVRLALDAVWRVAAALASSPSRIRVPCPIARITRAAN